MIDVIFKQNYFEELPDDIKDKILKKAKDMKFWDKINKGNLNIYKRLKKAKDVKNVYINLYKSFNTKVLIIRYNTFHCKRGEYEGDIFYYTNLKIFCDIVKKIIILYNFDEVLGKKYLVCEDDNSISLLYDYFRFFYYIVSNYNYSHIRYLYTDLLYEDEYHMKTSNKSDRYFFMKAFLKSELRNIYLIKELYDYFEYCFNKGFMTNYSKNNKMIIDVDNYFVDIRRYIKEYDTLMNI